MDAHFWLNVVMRWLHVASAVVGVGAIVFVGLALLPAAGAEGASVFVASVMRRFKRLLHVALGLLLVSGVYNLFVVIPKAEALGALKPVYHAVLGTKILLGLILIAVATIALAGRDAGGGAERWQSARSRWLALIVLAAVIIFLSATLRRTWDLASPKATITNAPATKVTAETAQSRPSPTP